MKRNGGDRERDGGREEGREGRKEGGRRTHGISLKRTSFDSFSAN